MQNLINEDVMLEDVSLSWSEDERKARRILALAKQRWLCDLIEMSEECEEPAQHERHLAVAG